MDQAIATSEVRRDMYVARNHPDYNRLTSPRTPPEDDGTLLVELPRGRDVVLKVSLSSYQSHPFVSLRVHKLDGQGRPWPTKAGCSVRIREIDDIIYALEHAKSILEGGERPGDDRRNAAKLPKTPIKDTNGKFNSGADEDQARPVFVDRRRRPQPRAIDPEAILRNPAGAGEFDEFNH